MSTLKECLERHGAWVTSNDEEYWPVDTSFALKEDAIAYAKSEGHQFLGRIQVPLPDNFVGQHQAENLLESIVCDSEAFAGEWFEGYLSDGITRAMTEKLGSMMAEVLHQWLEEFRLWPSSSNVVDIEEVAHE